MLVQWADGTNLATTTIGSNGTFTVTFTVPSNATQGVCTGSKKLDTIQCILNNFVLASLEHEPVLFKLSGSEVAQ